ncbi:MAG: hypothetical protein ACI4DP_02820 [Candidatus Ornithomonoglobus sp.]
MKKKIILAIASAAVLAVISGCTNRDGLVAKNVAIELMENGSYSAAAEQCAIAIGNGVKDKDFIHISDVINAYNDALSAFEDGDISEASEKISEIHDYSDLAMADDIEDLKEKIEDEGDNSETINDRLNEVKQLYDRGDYKAAQKKLYSISEDDMDANQRKNYDTFEINIENKLNAENSTSSSSSTVQHAGSAYNYSAYDNSLSTAYVSGAETGSVYFWTSSSGDSYTTTLTNGTTIYTTGHSSGGRTLVKWNGSYGWITSRYISSSYRRSYKAIDHYISGASSGSVYVWKSAYGDEYYTTITNGTSVTPTGNYSNGRSQIYWGNGYAWITSAYLY